MWQDIWQAIAVEFSDIPDLSVMTMVALRIIVAAALGGVLGYERERRSISAGVRTHMLVSVGGAIFMIGPVQAGMEIGDLSRVIQGGIQGIGFLGAGAIMFIRSSHTVQGMTTAATIWAAAGIGITVGLGLLSTAILATGLVLAILAVKPLFRSLTGKLDREDTVADGDRDG